MLLVSSVVFAPSDWLVVPGERMGNVRIDRPLPKWLPKPDGTDNATGHYQSMWRGRDGNRLNVFSSQRSGVRFGTPRVDIVYATSASFRLANGLHPGSSVLAMRNAFPGAKLGVAKLVGVPIQGKEVEWDDLRRGFGWTVAPNGTVSGFLVYRPGRRPYWY